MKAEFLPKTPDGRRYRLFEEMGEVLQAFGKAGRFGLESRHPDGGPTNRELILAELGDLRHAIGGVEIDVGPSSPRSILASESARQVVDGVCNDRGWAYREKLIEAITRAISTEVARGDALAASLGAAVSRAERAEARAREVEGQLEAAEARATDAEDRAEGAEARAEAAEAAAPKVDHRPTNCRHRLREAGQPISEFGCAACGYGWIFGCTQKEPAR